MSSNLLTIRSLSVQADNDSLFPSFDSNGQLQRNSDEEILWQGNASGTRCNWLINGAWHNLLRFRAKTEVIITNKRIVYICRKYKKGRKWIGSPGLMVLLDIIGAAWTAMDRYGKAALGQVRYEWPIIIVQGRSFVRIVCREGSGSVAIEIDVSQRNVEEVTKLLVEQISASRKITPPQGEPNKSGLIAYSLPNALKVPDGLKSEVNKTL